MMCCKDHKIDLRPSKGAYSRELSDTLELLQVIKSFIRSVTRMSARRDRSSQECSYAIGRPTLQRWRIQSAQDPRGCDELTQWTTQWDPAAGVCKFLIGRHREPEEVKRSEVGSSSGSSLRPASSRSKTSGRQTAVDPENFRPCSVSCSVPPRQHNASCSCNSASPRTSTVWKCIFKQLSNGSSSPIEQQFHAALCARRVTSCRRRGRGASSCSVMEFV